jgi:hypothetical protein
MPKFEIPTEMRQVAEKSLEEARKAFDGFIAAAQKAAAEIEEQATLWKPFLTLSSIKGVIALRQTAHSHTTHSNHAAVMIKSMNVNHVRG